MKSLSTLILSAFMCLSFGCGQLIEVNEEREVWCKTGGKLFLLGGGGEFILREISQDSVILRQDGSGTYPSDLKGDWSIQIEEVDTESRRVMVKLTSSYDTGSKNHFEWVNEGHSITTAADRVYTFTEVKASGASYQVYMDKVIKKGSPEHMGRQSQELELLEVDRAKQRAKFKYKAPSREMDWMDEMLNKETSNNSR